MFFVLILLIFPFHLLDRLLLNNILYKRLSISNVLESKIYARKVMMLRPYVIINCAMSADGKIALPSRIQTRISNEEDIRRVYELRNNCDAILVGINTVLSDDPRLIVKSKYVKKRNKPIRIVLDSKGRVPLNANILDSSAKTIIVTSEQCKREIAKAEVIRCGDNRIDLHRLLAILYDRGIRNLLVEGGETIIWSFLKEGLVNELYKIPFDFTGIENFEKLIVDKKQS